MAEKTNKQNDKAQHSEPENPAATKPRPLGLHKGKGWIGDNFNDPMPDDL